MKLKFRMKANILAYIIFSLLIIILLAGIIVNILVLSGAVNIESANIIGDIVSTCLMVLLLGLVCFVTFYPHYTVSDKFFTFHMGIVWRNIDYDDLLLLREDVHSGQILLYYKCYAKDGEEKINYLDIKINHRLNPQFIDSLRSHNNKLVYEPFDKYNTTIEDK